MDSLDMEILLAEQYETCKMEMDDPPPSPDHTVAEKENHKKYSRYHRMKYDRTRDIVLARCKAKYIPTGK
jgi:hypothetical protein